jgi:hypothetical protein
MIITRAHARQGISQSLRVAGKYADLMLKFARNIG